MLGRGVNIDRETFYKVECWITGRRRQQRYTTMKDAKADTLKSIEELKALGYEFAKPFTQHNRIVFRDLHDVNNFIMVTTWDN